MVDWYHPPQLLRTAQQVANSTLFGRHSDYRLIEALASAGVKPFQDFSGSPEAERAFWVDYVADTGDGWNSTYSIAYAAAQPALNLEWGGENFETQRGDILVFGGDEVYATPSNQNYENRLVVPYRAALRGVAGPAPVVFAVPGNHDWYDSLVAFTRRFCSKLPGGRTFGAWQTRQERSYFALKLPHRWWLVGTDIQLFSDVDAPQVEYFQRVAAAMKPEEKIILCNAEPHWIYAAIYGRKDDSINENNLAFLENVLFKKKISVFIAGDLHHYRRHAAPDGTQKITAGGGGAFLHPTHGEDASVLANGFTLQAEFPDKRISKKLCWLNLLFLLKNPFFGLLPAVLYLLTAWAVRPNLAQYKYNQTGAALEHTLWTAIQSPVTAFWGLALFVGIVLFTDTHSRIYRFTGGVLHGFAHLAALFWIGWAASHLAENLTAGPLTKFLLTGGLIFVGGWVIGSIIMGLYLLVSLNIFRRHAGEAFSSLKIPDYKNFLRLRIDCRGKLTIFPIAIQRVARKWKASTGGVSEFEPDDPAASAPELIEAPITLAP